MQNSLKEKKNEEILKITHEILEECKQNNIDVRVLGGVGIYLRCQNFRQLFFKEREAFSDIDFIIKREEVGKIESLFDKIGLIQNKTFKIHFGYQRRIFYNTNNITIEIYLDKLILCQELPVQLSYTYPALSITDLFLSKIQRKEMTQKDIFDISVLLAESMITDSTDILDLKYLEKICSNDWQWWYTIKNNLPLIYRNIITDGGINVPLSTQVTRIEKIISSCSKSISWKIRNLFGRLIPYYRVVE